MRNILIAVGVLGLVALGCSKKGQSAGAGATTDEGVTASNAWLAIPSGPQRGHGDSGVEARVPVARPPWAACSCRCSAGRSRPWRIGTRARVALAYVPADRVDNILGEAEGVRLVVLSGDQHRRPDFGPIRDCRRLGGIGAATDAATFSPVSSPGRMQAPRGS